MLRLKLEMVKKDLTNRQVANDAQIAECTLSNILRGKQHARMGRGDTAERIALAIGWPISRKEELFEEIHLQETR